MVEGEPARISKLLRFLFLLKDVADTKTVERVLRTALERNTVSGLADLLRDRATGLYNGEGFRALTAKYVTTGTLGEEAAVECIKQGVGEYVLKNNLAQLPHALVRSLKEKCEPGQGTLFRIYLPTTPNAGASPVAPPMQGVIGQEPRGTELILIAEDHESIREMARHSLLRLGYRVLSAADGEEALRLGAV